MRSMPFLYNFISKFDRLFCSLCNESRSETDFKHYTLDLLNVSNLIHHETSKYQELKFIEGKKYNNKRLIRHFNIFFYVL